MFKEGASQGVDDDQSSGGGTEQDVITEVNETETALTYDSVLERVRELSGIENPRSSARSIIWRWHYDLVRNGMVTYDELFHEAVVGMYLAIEEGAPVEQAEVLRSIGRQLEVYKGAVIGRKQDVTFSQLEGDAGEVPGEEMAENLRFRIKLEQVEDDTEEAMEEDDFITDLMRQSRQIVLEKGERLRAGQGQRDWEVFVRYLTGNRVEDICASCPWLNSVNSVEKALQRIILNLRENIAGATGANTTVNIISEGRPTRTNQQESRFDKQQYYREWYERNKKRRQEQMRNYQREKRARSRDLGSTQDQASGNIA